MKIRVKKVVSKKFSDPRAYEVISIEALEEYQLPQRYFDTYPYCYKYQGINSELIVKTGNQTTTLQIGYPVEKKVFEKLVETIAICCARLDVINKEIEDITAGWIGEVEISL